MSKFILGCCVLLFLVAITTVIILADLKLDQQMSEWAAEALHRAQAKERFIKEHCKVEGYVGKEPTRLFRCDDGQLYIWQDLPVGD